MPLTCTEFGELVEIFRELRGQCILGTARTRDWRVRLDSKGTARMTGGKRADRSSDAIDQDGSFHVFMLLSGRRLITLRGSPFNEGDVTWVARGSTPDATTEEPISWLNVTVSVDVVLSWADMHDDEPDHRLLDRCSQSAASMPAGPLLRLAHRLFCADARSCGTRNGPAERHAAHEAILDSLRAMALPSGESVHARSHAHHVEVLDKALELIESTDTELLRLKDLCVATGVSERTVRSVFTEYLGMSPHRYLMVRRLQAIRSAIHRAGPRDTITSICAQFGEWDFGRLAKRYKAQFGELPSESLYGLKRRGPNGVAAEEGACSRVPEALRSGTRRTTRSTRTPSAPGPSNQNAWQCR